MSKCRYDLSADCSSNDCLPCILDKIGEEVEQTRKMYLDMNDIDWLNGCDYVLSVVDKYRGESEEEK